MRAGYKQITITGIVLTVAAITVFFIIMGNSHFPVRQSPTKEEKIILAENWIKNLSSRYPAYGRDLSLEEERRLGEDLYSFKFSFVADHPGYGTHQHEIVAKVEGSEVISVIRDDIFDEKERSYLEKEKDIDIYFVFKENETKRVDPVRREISYLPEHDIKSVVFTDLLKGPTDKENEMGYDNYIDDEVVDVLSFYLDEEGSLEIVMSGIEEEKLELAEKQVEMTMMQIKEVKNVNVKILEINGEISIEGIPEDFEFSRNMSPGVRGEDVRYLQILLNDDPETMLTDSGPGSSGNETEYFGEICKNAVERFQKKHFTEIEDPRGHVGDNTMEKLNNILRGNP